MIWKIWVYFINIFNSAHLFLGNYQIHKCDIDHINSFLQMIRITICSLNYSQIMLNMIIRFVEFLELHLSLKQKKDKSNKTYVSNIKDQRKCSHKYIFDMFHSIVKTQMWTSQVWPFWCKVWPYCPLVNCIIFTSLIWSNQHQRCNHLIKKDNTFKIYL